MAFVADYSFFYKTKSHLLNCKCDIFVNITSPTQLQDGTTYDSNNIIHHICMKSISKLFGKVAFLGSIFFRCDKFFIYRIREIFSHFLKAIFYIMRFRNVVIFSEFM